MSGLPYDLVLVRHGESEGNVALNASKKGDNRYFDIPGFRDRPGHDWRRTIRPASNSPVNENWREINRPVFTNEQLLEGLENIPQLIAE